MKLYTSGITDKKFLPRKFWITEQSAHGKLISVLSSERESNIRSKQKIYARSDSFMNFKVCLRLTANPCNVLMRSYTDSPSAGLFIDAS